MGSRVRVNVSTRGRLIAICAVVVGVLLLNEILGKVLVHRRTLQRIVAPSGSSYEVIYDVMSADGHYYLAYRASSTEPSAVLEQADELVEIIGQDPRMQRLKLKTIGIEAQREYRFGLFHYTASSGMVYRRRGDHWAKATQEELDEHLRSLGAIPVH